MENQINEYIRRLYNYTIPDIIRGHGLERQNLILRLKSLSVSEEKGKLLMKHLNERHNIETEIVKDIISFNKSDKTYKLKQLLEIQQLELSIFDKPKGEQEIYINRLLQKHNLENELLSDKNKKELLTKFIKDREHLVSSIYKYDNPKILNNILLLDYIKFTENIMDYINVYGANDNEKLLKYALNVYNSNKIFSKNNDLYHIIEYIINIYTLNIPNYILSESVKKLIINSFNIKLYKLIDSKFESWFSIDENILKIILTKILYINNIELSEYIINILGPISNLSDNSKNDMYVFFKEKILFINKYIEVYFKLFDIYGYDIINETSKFYENITKYNNRYLKNHHDIAFRLFEILLTKENGSNIVFDIIDENIIYTIELVKIAMSDHNYHPIILEYLNKLLKFKDDNDMKYNKLSLELLKTYPTVYYADYSENNPDYDKYDEYIPTITEDNKIKYIHKDINNKISKINQQYFEIIENKLDEQAHYYLAQILWQTPILTEKIKDKIMFHLLKANDYADSESLRIKLLNLYYNISLDYFEYNTESIIKLINLLKK